MYILYIKYVCCISRHTVTAARLRDPVWAGSSTHSPPKGPGSGAARSSQTGNRRPDFPVRQLNSTCLVFTAQKRAPPKRFSFDAFWSVYHQSQRKTPQLLKYSPCNAIVKYETFWNAGDAVLSGRWSQVPTAHWPIACLLPKTWFGPTVILPSIMVPFAQNCAAYKTGGSHQIACV